jgi:MoxR-like ATPase
MNDALAILKGILANVGKVIVGKDAEIQKILCCWMAGGHILIEDVPGTGKTILARAIARSCDVPFNRVQFTPDLLPADIIGTSIYRQNEGRFEFVAGPLFTTVLLGDEINRATPRTQSALLEAMSEGQVSVDRATTALDPLFLTIATQNPVDQLGTFPLPEAQLDRFMMKVSMGYPQPSEEVKIIQNQNRTHPINEIRPVESRERLLWVRERVPEVHIGDEVYAYIMALVSRTREHRELKVGASPRASIALARAAQALALFEGSAFVSPSHVHQLVKPVVAHRLILKPEAKISGRSASDILEEIIRATPVPMRKK